MYPCPQVRPCSTPRRRVRTCPTPEPRSRRPLVDWVSAGRTTIPRSERSSRPTTSAGWSTCPPTSTRSRSIWSCPGAHPARGGWSIRRASRSSVPSPAASSAGWTWWKTLDDDNFEVDGLEPGKSRTVSFLHKDRRLAGRGQASSRGHGLGPRCSSLACGSATGRPGRLRRGYAIAGRPDHARVAGSQPGTDPGQYRRSGPVSEVFVADKDGRFPGIEGINSCGLSVGRRRGPIGLSSPTSSSSRGSPGWPILQHLTARPPRPSISARSA